MTTTADLLKTPLYEWHVAHGGRMVDFAGWSMPVQYTSIVEEHVATRTAVGVFDISHMGRLAIGRMDATQFLDAIATRRVTDMRIGQVRYSLVCNENGGILDDVLIYCTDAAAKFCLVVNASNRDKIVAWLNSALCSEQYSALDVGLADYTLESPMIAVQGPKAIEVLSPLVNLDNDSSDSALSKVRYYHCTKGSFDGNSILVSRTGYTGEDGFEIICDRELSPQIWSSVVEAAEQIGGRAVGLAARDTLRLEAAMPLYGHELSETINPFQAGLAFAVNLEGRDFVGRAALEKFAADKSQPVRVGLSLDGKRVPRQGCVVHAGDEIVGEVTSGTFSPTFERPIAMAYVRPSAQAVGTRLTIDIRGAQHEAIVVPLPFYQRPVKS